MAPERPQLLGRRRVAGVRRSALSAWPMGPETCGVIEGVQMTDVSERLAQIQTVMSCTLAVA